MLAYSVISVKCAGIYLSAEDGDKMMNRMVVIRCLKFAGLLIVGLPTGYLFFLLYLKVSDNLEEWKRDIRQKYGVGIWDV